MENWLILLGVLLPLAPLLGVLDRRMGESAPPPAQASVVPTPDPRSAD